MQKSFIWHKIAGSPDELGFGVNRLAEIIVSGTKICIVRSGDLFKACAAKCPHASGVLAEGYLDTQGNIVCPVHRYKFSLENGRNVSGEGYYLKTYPVEMRGDGLYLGLPAGGLMKWLG